MESVPGRGTAPLEANGVAPDDEAAVLLRTYRLAVLTRALDERMWILSRQGAASFVLTARGHEIAQVASVLPMRVGHDSAWPYYRDMAVGLALGVTPYEVFLGAMGRADDPHSGGRQLSMHLSSPRLRIGSISSEIGAHVPLAVGAAYAARVKGEDSVAVCWFGDGAASEGATHEAMNLAGVQRLPVVFVCENNGLAISVPLRLQMPIASMAERGAAYGMPGVSVDGTDTLAVYRACRAAIERARAGDGPSLIETRVPRITPHSSQDDDAYRTEEERAAAAAADPLPRLRRDLLDRRLLTEAEDAELVRAAHAQVAAEADRAMARPAPTPERARRWLFAGDPPHPYLAELEGLRGADGGSDG